MWLLKAELQLPDVFSSPTPPPAQSDSRCELPRPYVSIKGHGRSNLHHRPCSGHITFVDFEFKVISGRKSLVRTKDGMIPEISELDRSMKQIRDANRAIISQRGKGYSASEDESRVLAVVEDAERLYGKLQNSIGRLKVNSEARFKSLENGRIAFNSLWGKGELLELSKRLIKLYECMQSSVQFMLQL